MQYSLDLPPRDSTPRDSTPARGPMSQPHLNGVLKLDELAAELTHETFEADTKDREDHTFSGIMFDVACQSLPRGPVEYIEVQSLAVRGQLGPVTVWSTEGGFTGKHERKDEWTLRYDAVHPASPNALVELRLSQPVQLRLGERCGLYVHSALPGDEGIVYDDQHQRLTYEDPTFKVYSHSKDDQSEDSEDPTFKGLLPTTYYTYLPPTYHLPPPTH